MTSGGAVSCDDRLVDSPAINWGGESKLRAEVEMLYARFVACPIVCLCVQGGPGTVELLYESAMKKTPCVIVAQSGGGLMPRSLNTAAEMG